jgi:hypothetical protein
MDFGIFFIIAMAHTPTRRIGTSLSALCTTGSLARSCWFGSGETADVPPARKRMDRIRRFRGSSDDQCFVGP